MLVSSNLSANARVVNGGGGAGTFSVAGTAGAVGASGASHMLRVMLPLFVLLVSSTVFLLTLKLHVTLALRATAKLSFKFLLLLFVLGRWQ